MYFKKRVLCQARMCYTRLLIMQITITLEANARTKDVEE